MRLRCDLALTLSLPLPFFHSFRACAAAAAAVIVVIVVIVLLVLLLLLPRLLLLLFSPSCVITHIFGVLPFVCVICIADEHVN